MSALGMPPFKVWIHCFLLYCLCGTIQAAPEPPLEELFRRAETVWLARVVSAGNGSVTLQCIELLRGNNDREMTLKIDGGENSPGAFLPRNALQAESEFLLLSQGDEKKGPPQPVIGHSFESQFDYRGWTPFPIKRSHHQIRVWGTLSFADRRFTKNLPLSYVEQLLDQFPYGSIPTPR